MSSNTANVQRGASETGSALSQVLSAVQSMSSDSNRLKLEVGKFLNSMRAASQQAEHALLDRSTVVMQSLLRADGVAEVVLPKVSKILRAAGAVFV
jgi:hypothetical protein